MSGRQRRERERKRNKYRERERKETNTEREKRKKYGEKNTWTKKEGEDMYENNFCEYPE